MTSCKSTSVTPAPACRMAFLPAFLLLLAMGQLLPAAAVAVTTQGYDIAPAPTWVLAVPPADEAQALRQNNSNGLACLLVDEQWRVDSERTRHFSHFVNKVLNVAGLTEASQIAIDFDPLYESLILHHVLIHRDGSARDGLKDALIHLIQRERDLDYQIYDGTKTLTIFLKDVRPGDRVEYSYTIEGANPVFAGHFAESLPLGWEQPVARVSYRLLWQTARPLHLRNHATNTAPVTTPIAGGTEYLWRLDGVKERHLDQGTPGWYDPFPAVYVSDMAGWGEVAAWALPLYRPVGDAPEQEEILAAIRQSAQTTEERILAALRFVQEEVRYLGIEMGPRSHRPSQPDAIIAQRFGDCKDKSRLLVSLLQGLGVDASVALVNSYGGKQLLDVLPTPTAFDHVIVRVRLNGKTYWLDPTLTHQRGRLAALYQPDYQYALVVAPDTTGLTPMTPDTSVTNRKTVEEHFVLSADLHGPATYQLASSYEGLYADSFRGELEASNPSQIQQALLNDTARSYPGVQVAAAMRIDDDEENNRLTLTEHYSIQDIWTPSEDGRFVYADFAPFLIFEPLQDVEAPIRTMPYVLSHPVRFRQTTHIAVPPGADFDQQDVTVDDPAFRFTKKATQADNVLTLEYVYESRADHVDPEEMVRYVKDLRQARDLATCRISIPNPGADAAPSQGTPGQ